jgi:U6 snRNA-associated Sm-like protein LSm5
MSRQGDKELVGTLRGFDEYVNMVMDDAVQIESGPYGRKETKLGQILLNNANVTLIVPGGSPTA